MRVLLGVGVCHDLMLCQIIHIFTHCIFHILTYTWTYTCTRSYTHMHVHGRTHTTPHTHTLLPPFTTPPIQVGLAGASGSGKTTFSNKLQSLLPGIIVLSMDMYNDSSKVVDGNFDGTVLNVFLPCMLCKHVFPHIQQDPILPVCL